MAIGLPGRARRAKQLWLVVTDVTVVGREGWIRIPIAEWERAYRRKTQGTQIAASGKGTWLAEREKVSLRTKTGLTELG
jgi:hypothetical protein